MRLIQRLLTDAPLFIDGSLQALLVHSFPAGSDDFQAAEHPALKRLRDATAPQVELRNGIAIVPVEGALARKPDVFELAYGGIEDSQRVLDMVEGAASNAEVSGILLNIDSPGGFLTGGPEIADAVKYAGKLKPVVAWTGGMMASLAYWIGSQAGTVIASRSAIVGSIGVYTALYDYSKYLEALGVKVEVIKNKEAAFKAIGMVGTSLNDEQRSHLQERIQASFSEFRRTVKSARPGVADESMRGQVFTGMEAKNAALVDRVGDMNFALSVLRSEIRARAKK